MFDYQANLDLLKEQIILITRAGGTISGTAPELLLPMEPPLYCWTATS